MVDVLAGVSSIMCVMFDRVFLWFADALMGQSFRLSFLQACPCELLCSETLRFAALKSVPGKSLASEPVGRSWRPVSEGQNIVFSRSLRTTGVQEGSGRIVMSRQNGTVILCLAHVQVRSRLRNGVERIRLPVA